ncbi:tripartite tricarboxylate transporter substrate-binding protein [Pseudorhodoferax sp. Leaf267]|uniref:tripartite tricarboxylate transporter substrate-binding protein n=1 Tax=Pseudorhodoferax sp. Leaf267 TaxID=1736316 RepID=UPI0006FC0D17|nr:tripartite tricarboxylate transporter substrate-binding protein [Pseudorhodoferax sp. Leaf267]KQP17313.1 hypothetical protein ASF43_29260 [Pseudorhodoferax sp. Leaf267]
MPWRSSVSICGTAATSALSQSPRQMNDGSRMVPMRSTPPGVPTLAESGIRGVAVGDPWYGLFAPKGVPSAVLAAWHNGLDQLRQDASVMGALGVINADPVLSSPEAFAQRVAADEKAFDALVAVHPMPQ